MKDVPAYAPSGNETKRQSALTALGVLDTPPERELDDISRLAAAALNVQSAGISVIDSDRQWFKSRHGISFDQTAREHAFCAHTVDQRSPLIIPDASADPRFADNPLVTENNGIRYYAGVPLLTREGYCVGALCAFDPTPRPETSPAQLAVLEHLAQLAMELIETRTQRRLGEIAAKVVDATSDAVLAVNMSGAIIYWNRAAETLFGRAAEEALGQPVEIIMPSRLVENHRQVFARAAQGGQTRLVGRFIELIAARHDGTEFPIELSLARWGDANLDQGFAAVIRDISVRRALERDREHARAFLDNVVTNLPGMLFVKDVESRRYLMVNRAGESLIGRPANEIIGRTDLELFPEYGAGYEQRDSDAVARPQHPHIFESVFTRDDGQAIHLRTTRKLVDGPLGPNQYIMGISEDVTQTRIAQAEVVRLARYDPLTGLLNRASYNEKLHTALKAGWPFALLTIDLDRFKDINDQHGHMVGDAALSVIGERLQSLVGPTDWVARIGGDEFIVVLSGENLRCRATRVAEMIVASLGDPIKLPRGVIQLGASVGGVLMPDDGRTLQELRENADLALYRAKRNGRSRADFFDADMDAEARDRKSLEISLRDAVQAGSITLAYQPLVSALTGQITSAEALARWTHPVKGPIRPDIFIGIAESCGLIDKLGEQLLRQACAQAMSWPTTIRVAVNLSPMQFLSGKLPETVRGILADTGLEPARLQLEVTEGLVIRDVERTFLQLQQLREIGIQILIDDFGVGYSSLSYFQRFPFDKVKIDKSFVDDISTSRAARAIVQAVVGLGKELDMGVVAEGVETDEQRLALSAIGCTHLQGYLFSPPLPSKAFSQLLETSLFIPISERTTETPHVEDIMPMAASGHRQ